MSCTCKDQDNDKRSGVFNRSTNLSHKTPTYSLSNKNVTYI